MSRRTAEQPKVKVFAGADGARATAALERNSVETARALDENKGDRWVIRRVSAADAPRAGTPAGVFNASFGDYVLVDPTNGELTIVLPKPTGADAGREIVVKNATDSTTNVNVRPAGDGVRIDNDTAPMTLAVSYFAFVVTTDGKDYWTRL